MFKYTRASIDLILNEIRRYCKIFKYATPIITAAYFIYALVVGMGILWANITLLSLCVAYTIFEIIAQKTDVEKRLKKVVKRTYKWIKLAIKASTLGIMIYGIYTAEKNVTPISIILATLMIIMWILQIVSEILIEFIENKSELVIAAWTKDMEDIRKPITTVENVLKKIKGEEIAQPQKSKELLKLEKFLDEKKQAEQEEKRLAKEENQNAKSKDSEEILEGEIASDVLEEEERKNILDKLKSVIKKEKIEQEQPKTEEIEEKPTKKENFFNKIKSTVKVKRKKEPLALPPAEDEENQ